MAKDGKRTFRSFEDMGAALGRRTDKVEDKPASSPEQAKSPEETANDILNYLAERLGRVGRYESEIREEEIAQELYSKFGVYDADFVYRHWTKMKETPFAIQNPTLKQIAQSAEADSGFDHSYVSDTLAFSEPALVPIRQQILALETTVDIGKKRELLENIKRDLDTTIKARKYTAYKYGKTEELELRDLDYDPDISVHSGRGSVAFSDIARALQRTNFHIKFDEKLGALDRTRLKEETLKYGAKGANLEELRRIKDAIGMEFGTYGLFEVPEYKIIPASVYEKSEASGRIIDDEDIKSTFDWINKRKVIIRSSAVHSEDAEDTTGAGIYKSVILDEGANFRAFVTKIKEVYKSVNSPEAKKYRADNGISEEKMGIVVQEYVDSSPDDRGYVNGVVKNVPELMEIVYDSGLRPIVVKERAAEAIVHGETHSPIFHYELDIGRKFSHQVTDLALLITLIEKHYGQPLQVEFLEAEKDRVTTTHIVQARFLPRNFSDKLNVEFPQEQSLFEGRAVGAFDLTLPVLPNNRDNRNKNGVVVFQSSTFFTMGEYGAQRAMPESGAVIVLGPPVEGGGHIETICAERGLALIFSDEGAQRHDAMRQIAQVQLGIRSGVAVRTDNLDGFRTLRLVSNGLQGKVYGVGEKDSGEEQSYDNNRGL